MGAATWCASSLIIAFRSAVSKFCNHGALGNLWYVVTVPEPQRISVGVVQKQALRTRRLTIPPGRILDTSLGKTTIDMNTTKVRNP